MREQTGASTVPYDIAPLHPCSSPKLHGRKQRLGEGSAQLGDLGAGPQTSQPPKPQV